MGDIDQKRDAAVEKVCVAPDTRRRQLDAVDRLVAMAPLPAPESLSEWNREYSRLKSGEGRQHGDDQPSPSRP